MQDCPGVEMPGATVYHFGINALGAVSVAHWHTVCAEMFARRNFRELLAELKFRVFIFANDCLIIYISYIAYILVLLFTLLSVQKDGGIVRFC